LLRLLRLWLKALCTHPLLELLHLRHSMRRLRPLPRRCLLQLRLRLGKHLRLLPFRPHLRLQRLRLQLRLQLQLRLGLRLGLRLRLQRRLWLRLRL